MRNFIPLVLSIALMTSIQAGEAPSPALNLADWEVRTWDGRRWVSQPVNKMTLVRTSEGVKVTNSTGIHKRAQFCHKRVLPGNFSCTIEVRGVHDAQKSGYVQLRSASDKDQAVFGKIPHQLASRWQTISFARSNGRLTVSLNGNNVPLVRHHARGDLRGRMSVILEANRAVEIRSIRFAAASTPVIKSPPSTTKPSMLPAEVAGEPTAADRAEAKVFLDLARKALQAGKLKSVELWIKKSTEKCPLAEAAELQADYLVKTDKKDEAVRLYVVTRESYRGRKEDFDRLTAKMRKLCPDLGKYLALRDGFVISAKFVESGFRTDAFARSYAASDLRALSASATGSKPPATAKGKPDEMAKAEAEAFLGLAKKSYDARKYTDADSWLKKAEARQRLPGISELRGDLLTKQYKQKKAMPEFIKAREGFRNSKADLKRLNAKIASLSKSLPEYLGKRDRFLASAKAAVDGFDQHDMALELASRDLAFMKASANGLLRTKRATAPKTTTTADASVPAKIRTLFHGRVRSLDAATLKVELHYDFSNAEQLKDWSLGEWRHRRSRGKGAISIRNGRLYLAPKGRDALLKAKFSSVALHVSFDCRPRGKNAGIVVCSDGKKGNQYYGFALQDGTKAYITKGVNGKPVHFFPGVPSPFAAAKRGSMSTSFANGVLKATVGHLKFEERDNSHTGGQAGLWAGNSEAFFDDLRIVGTLDRTWFQSQ